MGQNKMTNRLSMYGTTAGFKEKDGMIEQVMLGQVIAWDETPNSMFGIGLDRSFIESIAKKTDKSLEQYIGTYSGKHTRAEIAPSNQDLQEIKDGEGGARTMLQFEGTFKDITQIKTFWRRNLKNFEADADMMAKIRASESSNIIETPYQGKIVISGPDYALEMIRKFFDENPSRSYKLKLVSKAQHLAFVSKY